MGCGSQTGQYTYPFSRMRRMPSGQLPHGCPLEIEAIPAGYARRGAMASDAVITMPCPSRGIIPHAAKFGQVMVKEQRADDFQDVRERGEMLTKHAPMKVPSGEPKIVATVRPAMTVANARPPLPGPRRRTRPRHRRRSTRPGL